MTIRTDFNCYKHILVIDLGYSFRNGTGYALFDHEAFRLIDCGVIKPFAPGLSNFNAAEDIGTKTKILWENLVGFSYDPKLLVIEYPRIYPNSVINNNPLLTMAYLAGLIRRSFKTPLNQVQLVYANEWKGTKDKLYTQNIVIETLDKRSKNILDESLSSLHKIYHHNVYDAVGLGLWAIEKFKTSLEK